MGYYVSRRMGGDSDLPVASFRDLLLELEEDPEHTSVSVTHESDWCIGVYRNGFVILEHLEDLDLEPRHLAGQTEETILALLTAISQGYLASVERHPWRPGYGNETA